MDTASAVAQTASDCGTQKARGLFELTELSQDGYSWRLRVPEFRVFLRKPTQDEYGFGSWQERFARPCPKTPRHGFEDSRVVVGYDDAMKVWEKAKAADPEAELIVMEPIKATSSAIWTSGMLAVGRGNDGATGGKNSVIFPTSDKAPIDGPYESIQRSPYFEIVSDEARPYVVQLRDGPALPKVKDWIPGKMLVTEVISVAAFIEYVNANGLSDLLAWEERMHSVAGKEGVVVVHPGGTLASHWGVHAKENGIAYVTTFEPKVGDTIEATVEVKPADLDAIVEGIKIGISTRKIHMRKGVQFMFAVLHSSGWWDLSDKNQARWYGAALGLACRLGFNASLGEARHATKSRRTRDRNVVFEKYWDSFQLAKTNMSYVWRVFLTHAWSSSYGGVKWASCAESSAKLWNLLVEIVAGKNEKARRKAVTMASEALNRLAHEVHNGGSLFDKFVSASFLDLAAENPSKAATWVTDTIMTVVEESPLDRDGAHRPIVFSKIKPPVVAQPDPVAQVCIKGILKADVAPKDVAKSLLLHAQWKKNKKAPGYKSGNFMAAPAVVAAILFPEPHRITKSYAGGSGTDYYAADVVDGKITINTLAGPVVLGSIE